MRMTRREAAVGGLSLLGATSVSTLSRAEWSELNIGEGLDDFWLATDAYIYGYPLVTMEMTRRVMTNVAAPQETRAPMGQFVRAREYPNASYRDVTAPNADTLYTIAWINVGAEPWVLSIPDMKDRYFLFPMLDGWTMRWNVNGNYCTGTPEDYQAVHELQDQCKLVPLSAYGNPYTLPEGKVDASIDMKTAVRDQVNRMDAKEYFTLLAQLMETNPPSAADAPALNGFAKIGLVPGKDFDASKLNADFVKRIPQVAFDRIMLQFKINRNVKHINGWNYVTKTGVYGTDYLVRALVTAVGLGANRSQDAVYPTSLKDADDKDYEGSNKYIIHFEKGQTPPVEGFWSITMYDAQYFFVANPINRYSISPRQNLKASSDGSIDIYVQKDTPGADKEANWLPAPAGKFILMLRMYWPNESDPSILDGTWTIPPVKKAA